jgi:hypothetical protein
MGISQLCRIIEAYTYIIDTLQVRINHPNVR